MDDRTRTESVRSAYRLRGQPGVLAISISGLGVASVTARKNSLADLMAAIADLYGLQLLDGPRYVASQRCGAAGVAPRRWLAMTESAPSGWASQLAEELRGLAAVVDLSAAYVVTRLQGEYVRAALSRLVPVDLHPTVFRVGAVAVTDLERAPVILIHRSAESFELLTARSYAADVEMSLCEAAREWGYIRSVGDKT
ncbi:MAG TPA: sarcosine oxidase subunit gamma family protein [Steroidobacteraceae bacterium]|nr:sarcosine oxidase subunit gamma family protein [Steroidobacteraceae bacterium]